LLINVRLNSCSSEQQSNLPIQVPSSPASPSNAGNGPNASPAVPRGAGFSIIVLISSLLVSSRLSKAGVVTLALCVALICLVTETQAQCTNDALIDVEVPSNFVVRMKCRNGCSGHGWCSPVGQCQCDAGYTGFDCSQATAQCSQCSSNGNCINGACVCNTGYAGPACTLRTSTPHLKS